MMRRLRFDVGGLRSRVLGIGFGVWLGMLAGMALAGDAIPVEARRPFDPDGRPLEGLIITLDAGHGGSAHQPGYSGSAVGVNSGVIEGDLNILVTSELFYHLRQAGAQVFMTRRDDRKVTLGNTDRAEELGARTRLAEKTQSHLFLALHHNAAPRVTADGVMILIWPTDKAGNDQALERAFADALREEVEKKVHHTEKFGHYINDHPLVSGSDIPSAVVEFGFLTNPEFDAWVSQGGSHREEAVGVHNAIVRMWTEHRADLKAKRAENFPGAKPVEVKPRKSGDEGFRDSMAGIARQLNPSGIAPVDGAAVQPYIELYKRAFITDRTFFLLNARVEGGPGAWKLTGKTNMPGLKRTLGGVVEALGASPLENGLTVLPAEKLGEKRFGVVQIPMALTWGEPGEGGSAQTQLLLGEPVFLLDETDDGSYILHHATDGYIGWVRSEAIRKMDGAEFGEWNRAAHVRVVVNSHAKDLVIPAGALLPLVSMSDGGTTATLRIPSVVGVVPKGPTIDLPGANVRTVDAGTGRRVAEAALQFLTTPYVFSGRSPHGLDCSGLVGVSWATVGVTLPRDANQQVTVGKLVGTPWYLDGLEPGDAVFFLDETGKVYHTGISIGGKRFVHSSPPEVQVSSFDPADPLYSEGWTKAFCFARRPVD